MFVNSTNSLFSIKDEETVDVDETQYNSPSSGEIDDAFNPIVEPVDVEEQGSKVEVAVSVIHYRKVLHEYIMRVFRNVLYRCMVVRKLQNPCHLAALTRKRR